MEDTVCRRVLCVEDDAITIMFTRQILIKSNFTKDVLTARNGQEAIDLLSAATYSDLDLILLDINMPVMNGWEFLDEYTRHLKQKYPNTAVVILSSSVFSDDFEKADSYEVVAEFNNKPFTMEMVTRLKERMALVKRPVQPHSGS